MRPMQVSSPPHSCPRDYLDALFGCLRQAALFFFHHTHYIPSEEATMDHSRFSEEVPERGAEQG